jgi:hypothetical protein
VGGAPAGAPPAARTPGEAPGPAAAAPATPTPAAAREPDPGAPAEPESALDLGSLGTAIVADRLRDPRLLTGLVAAVAFVAFLAGRRSKGR